MQIIPHFIKRVSSILIKIILQRKMGLCHSQEKNKRFEKHHPAYRSMRKTHACHVRNHNTKNISEGSFKKIVLKDFEKFDINGDMVL